MKKILIILIIGISMLSLVTLDDVDKNVIIDTKWYLKGQNAVVAIYFKHDYTFWHYATTGLPFPNDIDSNMICNWQLFNDKIYLSCIPPDSVYNYNRWLSYQVLLVNEDKLILRSASNKTCLEYLKLK